MIVLEDLKILETKLFVVITCFDKIVKNYYFV